MEPISAGSKLGSYEITSLLGKGGMGEVYRALDSKLNREVAIKILPEEFANDPDRVARFHREAQTIAALNHPNIAGIHELGETGSSRFLVLELVEGETLAERIARSAIPVDETLHIAKQICEALEAAHERGVIHRDLKPANVKITPDGKVKVLDFGLAKAIEGRQPNSALSHSPTLMSASIPGVILGTVAYMSPEQARGINTDQRSDIFSFGCVLYEMLTGKQAFEGELVSDVLASVLKSDPDLSALPAALDPRIQKLLRRLLEKNPKRRWHAVGDVRLEIEAILAEPAAAIIASATVRRPVASRFAIPVVLTLVAGVILGAAGYWYWNLKTTAPAATARFQVLPPEKMTFYTGGRVAASAVVSPDGRKLAFTAGDSSGRTTLWLRSIDSLSAQSLSGTEGASLPFWSPDSRYIAYFANGKLLKIAESGGPSQTLCDAPNGRGGAWNRDGVILFGMNAFGPLRRVSSGGGPVTEATRGPDTGRFPSFLPDGRHFLFQTSGVAPGTGGAGLYVASLDDPNPILIPNIPTGAIYISPGYLLFAREGMLMAQSFDANTVKLSGDPFPVAEQVESAVFNGVMSFSVSDTGVLTYGVGASTSSDLQMVWVDRQGKTIETAGQPGAIRGVDLSPDGKRIAVHRHEGQGGDVWILESPGGPNSRFTFDAAQENSSPIWSPDGKRIAFGSRRAAGKWGLYIKPASGTGNEDLVFEANLGFLNPTSWSPDAASIVYTTNESQTSLNIYTISLTGDRKPVPLLNTQFNESHGQVSPDGKWLAYQSLETNRPEIYVKPFPKGDGKWQVSTNGGGFPRWRADGRELFFIGLGSNAKVMAVDIKTIGSEFQRGTPKELFDSGYLNLTHDIGGTYLTYAVSTDGQRFLIPRPLSNATTDSLTKPIVVVTHWFEELKRRR